MPNDDNDNPWGGGKILEIRALGVTATAAVVRDLKMTDPHLSLK